MAIPTSMEDRDGHIWFDNKMTPWRDAKTHVLTHTLHYGMGVLEGVRDRKSVVEGKGGRRGGGGRRERK